MKKRFCANINFNYYMEKEGSVITINTFILLKQSNLYRRIALHSYRRNWCTKRIFEILQSTSSVKQLNMLTLYCFFNGRLSLCYDFVVVTKRYQYKTEWTKGNYEHNYGSWTVMSCVWKSFQLVWKLYRMEYCYRDDVDKEHNVGH